VAVPRYFFNLTNAIRTVVDADGVELADEEAMRFEAMEMVADLRKEISLVRTGADGVWLFTTRTDASVLG
jgi:hypothetical protein